LTRLWVILAVVLAVTSREATRTLLLFDVADMLEPAILSMPAPAFFPEAALLNCFRFQPL
jgi:hypothetical protein